MDDNITHVSYSLWRAAGIAGLLVVALAFIGWLAEWIRGYPESAPVRKRPSVAPEALPSGSASVGVALLPSAPHPKDVVRHELPALQDTNIMDAGHSPVPGKVPARVRDPSHVGSTVTLAPPSTWSGQAIARWMVGDRKGQGAMGCVYQARDMQTDELVAVKVLRPELSTDSTAHDRFMREVQSVRAVENHPNVVPVLDAGMLHGQPYYVMPWVEGGSLQDLLDEARRADKALPASMVASIISNVVNGLFHIHKAGIIHRDLKPANIMIDLSAPADQQAKIADFGLARQADGSDKLTMTGLVSGTPTYMSPEQCENRPLTVQSDWYSLGVIMYEMITGAPPFQAENIYGMLHAHMKVPPIDPTKTGNVSPSLSVIALHLLEKDMNRRPHGEDELYCLFAALISMAAVLGDSPITQMPDIYSDGDRYWSFYVKNRGSERSVPKWDKAPNFPPLPAEATQFQIAERHRSVQKFCRDYGRAIKRREGIAE